MREKISVFILCMLVAGIPTIAQTRSLSARIISSADSIPVEFATVKLMKDDSALVSATLTDENGVFRFDTPITSGMYLAISSVGCKNLNVPLPCDSVIYLDSSNVLSEVMVEASNQRTNTEVSTYIPMARQKNAAQNAVSLLSMMSIPQISVDPVSQAVQTAQGQNISIFIDYVPATTEYLSGMKTQDVKKVEYLIHPSDARFQGATYVINFVMQKYEWGGYTKLNAEKWFGVNQTKGSVYSKMMYKQMTFDIFADDTYLTNRHIGQKSVENFKFTDLYGEGPQSVVRTSDTESGRYRSNSNDISFRALYNTPDILISNRIAYSLSNTPHDDVNNKLSYSNGLFPESKSSTIASSRDWALKYNGEYYFKLSRHAGLNIEATYTYGSNNSNSNYTTTDELSITNDAKEDVHNATAYLHLNWNPNKANKFFTNFGVQHHWNIINYYGNSPSKQKYDVGLYFLGQNYTHVFNKKWNVGCSLAWIWETNRISGIKVDNNFPQTNINATWSPNDKNQLYMTANYGSMIPSASQKSPNMLQQDELMWYKGTPELKDSKYTNATLSYTWLPNNRWQLTTDAYLGYIKNRRVSLYSPTGPNGTILRQYFNNGDYFSDYFGISATGKFLEGKLVAKLRPQFWIRKTTGDYAWSSNQITCTAQVTYYLGNFYFLGWYMTPSKLQETNSGIIRKKSSVYQLQIGWGKGAWNLSATAYNFLHTSWDNFEESLTSEYYSLDRTTFGSQHHGHYALSVTYTVGYGKKVKRNNEISGAGTAGSAILK
ncbi:MAG: TonB-dependent receptor family protein [Muribaculaceae bacterium]|nr:TonB-dependent receptor family protein [Muribaculaceae bacterium]